MKDLHCTQPSGSYSMGLNPELELESEEEIEEIAEDTEDLTYEELVNYPSECSKADEQLKELRALQRRKAFDPDPDNLLDAERAYNGRLKATIWWYAYRCGKS